MLVLVAVAGAGGAARADDAADARRHAQRASALAASGKCKQAVREFDKAMAILRDPALLFNRGECHRKLGDNESALEDYRQFLADLPRAPNRADVEKRIAELTGQAPAADGGRSSAARGPVDATRGATRGAPRGDQSAAEVPPPRAVAPPRETTSEARPSAPSREIVLTPHPAGQTNDADVPGSELTIAEKARPPATSSDASLIARPWFWGAVAAVVVGVGVGTFIVLNRDGTTVPSSALGNYRF